VLQARDEIMREHGWVSMREKGEQAQRMARLLVGAPVQHNGETLQLDARFAYREGDYSAFLAWWRRQHPELSPPLALTKLAAHWCEWKNSLLPKPEEQQPQHASTLFQRYLNELLYPELFPPQPPARPANGRALGNVGNILSEWLSDDDPGT
jgi:hypothetical protein